MQAEQPDGRLEVVVYSAVILALTVVIAGLRENLRPVALALIVLSLLAINYRYRRLHARVQALEKGAPRVPTPPSSAADRTPGDP